MPAVHFGAMNPQVRATSAESARMASRSVSIRSGWWTTSYGVSRPNVPIFEAASTVAALAAVTERVEIGTLVTPIGMRNPFPPIAERLAQLREGVVMLWQMWDPEVEELTFRGKHFQTENLICLPKPPRRPPVFIVAKKLTMKLAAQLADIWNNPTGSEPELPHKIDVLRAIATWLAAIPQTLRSHSAACSQSRRMKRRSLPWWRRRISSSTAMRAILRILLR